MNFTELYQSLLEQDQFQEDDIETQEQDFDIDPGDPDPFLTDDLPFQRGKSPSTKDVYQITNLSISIPEMDVERKVSFNITKQRGKYIASITKNWGEEEGEEIDEVFPSKFAALAYVKRYKEDLIDSLKNAINELESSDSSIF